MTHKNHRKKKNPFTLLETLISFVIMGILLTIVFQFYTQLTKSKFSVKTKKDFVMSNAYFTTSLTTKFSLIPHPNPNAYSDAILSQPFYTLNDSLVFHFPEPNDEEIRFKGTLTSELQLVKKEVVLTTWPNAYTTETTPRVEVLLRGIDELVFSFFDCEKHTWESTWQRDAKQLPSMIKITTTKRVPSKDKEKPDQKIQNEYVIFLPQAQKPIMYKDKKSL
jgi:type II secretory pathway pseudopilin PulG